MIKKLVTYILATVFAIVGGAALYVTITSAASSVYDLRLERDLQELRDRRIELYYNIYHNK